MPLTIDQIDLIQAIDETFAQMVGETTPKPFFIPAGFKEIIPEALPASNSTIDSIYCCFGAGMALADGIGELGVALKDSKLASLASECRVWARMAMPGRGQVLKEHERGDHKGLFHDLRKAWNDWKVSCVA